MLWTFDIGCKYEKGVRQDIDPLAMTQGFNSRPMPFKAAFQVRNAEIQAVINREWQMAVKDVGVVLESVRSSMGRKT